MEFLSLLYTVLLVAICLQQALLLYRSGKPAPRQDDEALKEWVRQQLDAQSKLFAQKQAELARQNYDAMRGISETLQTAVQGMSSTLNAGQAGHPSGCRGVGCNPKSMGSVYFIISAHRIKTDEGAGFAGCQIPRTEALVLRFFPDAGRSPDWIRDVQTPFRG